MQNELLGSILNNIVMEKVVRDKIVTQQKQQRQEEARRRKQLQRDQFDQFEDEETRQIMRKMKNQRISMQQNMSVHQKKQEERTVGEYREIAQDQFLTYVTKLKFTVVHFFHKQFARCQIMDKHLKILCQQFPNTQFLAMNVQKCPFFIQKLGVRTLPTLCIFIDGVLKDKILGFQGLSGDEFLTYQLAAKLAESGVIQTPKGKAKDKTILKGQRRNNQSQSEGDD